MRFALAIIALVFSGVLLVLGIGQRTFLAGPAEIAVSSVIESETGYASIPTTALEGTKGQPFVEVIGDSAFAAVGATRDVDAWLAPIEHLEFSANAGKGNWEALEIPAVAESDTDDAPADFDPRGSDLWLTETGRVATNAAPTSPADTADAAASEADSVRIPVTVQSEESVLISVDPNSEIPAEVSLVWAQDTRTPFAGPLLAAGGLFALIGIVLYLIAVDHDRRGLGPQRGQQGPFLGIRNSLFGARKRKANGKEPQKKSASSITPREAHRSERSELKKKIALPVLGLVGLLTLSGCSAQYWPDLSSSGETETIVDEEAQTSTAAPTPVTPEQIDRIITDVVRVADEGDSALDPNLLASRFSGDALAQRTASYTVRASVPDYKVIPPRITDEALEYELVQSTEGWPRTVFATVSSDPGDAPKETESDAASPSLALIMTQASPHENFLVSRVVSLRGGITMPQAAPAEEGTALLADDLKTLTLSPGEVGPAYAAILAGGTGVEQATLFNLDGDTLIERSGAAWAAQSQATADAAEQGVRYSVTANQTDTQIVSLSTGVGGALVATTIVEERIEEPSSGRWKPTAPASVTALSGLTGQQDKLVSVVTHQLLFYVPGKDSNEQIQLLGYSSDLTGARNS